MRGKRLTAQYSQNQSSRIVYDRDSNCLCTLRRAGRLVNIVNWVGDESLRMVLSFSWLPFNAMLSV